MLPSIDLTFFLLHIKVMPCFPQCHWVYRTFEDVEELQRERGADEKEESPFSPYPAENGSDPEGENGTNGTGEKPCLC